MAGPERVGDYLLFPRFASGGMATIHLGRLVRAGFQRIVVVKRLHPEHAAQPGAADRLLREARLSSRARSPFVVPAIDVVQAGPELCLVMELVHGVTLARLLELASADGKALPPSVVVALFGDVLRGLHAAHEATGEDGKPLHVVHRDVTPRNILIGSDGLARVLDFGIAKALGHRSAMTTGDVRGTVAYMAPELLRGEGSINRRADVYSAGVVLWESLTGERLAGEGSVLPTEERLRTPPSRIRSEVPPAVDAVVLRALRSDPQERYASAEAMAIDLESALAPAPREEVVRLVEYLALDDLEQLREQVRACERQHDPVVVEEPRARSSRAFFVVLGALGLVGVGAFIALDRRAPSNGASITPAAPPVVREPAPVATPLAETPPIATSAPPSSTEAATSTAAHAAAPRPSTKTSAPVPQKQAPAASASAPSAMPSIAPVGASSAAAPRPPPSAKDPGADRM